MKIESKFEYLDIAYLILDNKIQALRIIEINFGISRSSSAYREDLFEHKGIKYDFRKKTFTQDDYLVTENGNTLWIEESELFKTKKELLEHLSKTAS